MQVTLLMQLNIHVHDKRSEILLERILEIVLDNQHKIKKIMASQAEDAQVLRDLLAQLQKANAEIQAKIQALVDAAANAPVSTELQSAIDDLKPAAQALDDIVPDAPPAPTA